MNKQMTPAEIEPIQQGFAKLTPILDKGGLVGVESGHGHRRRTFPPSRPPA